MTQTITRKTFCRLCDGKGTMTLRPAPMWFSWCRQCNGNGWVVVRIPVAG